MVNRRFLALVSIGAAVLACQSRLHNDSRTLEDSGIRGPSFELQLRHAERLVSEYPDFVSKHPIGRTAVGDLEIFLLRIGRNGTFPEKRPVVLITDATHGDEYTGVVDRLTGLFAARAAASDDSPSARFINAGGLIYFFPVVNPTGYMRNTRKSVDGRDVNRLFLLDETRQSPQVRQIVQAFEERLRTDNGELRVSMDYHCCAPADVPAFIRTDNKYDTYLKHENPAAQAAYDEFAAMATAVFGNPPLGSYGDIYGDYERIIGDTQTYFHYKYLEAIVGEKFAVAITAELAKKAWSARRNPNEFPMHEALWNRIFERVLQ